VISRSRAEIKGPAVEGSELVLTDAAVGFVGELIERFGPEVDLLLARRKARQEEIDRGTKLEFLSETRAIRESPWTVARLPQDLIDRRVEITGPVDRKMIINALNSGASVFMADFEDSTAPTWKNLIEGQINLFDAVRRTITFVAPETRKTYALGDRTATLMVRPRGWHLPEDHFLVGDRPAPGALVDFGLYFFHNAKALVAAKSGPYFYLPKMQSHLEARLWNDVFVWAQDKVGLPRGTIKATCLIETLPAAFEMHEILWELRDHSAGLNCGRWDYIFSFIKTLRADSSAVVPDRAEVGMTQPFMRAYTQLLVRTCHARGVHAMGGMAAQIPIKNDPERNDAALAKVRADKLREVTDGHDGTWVAHPALVPIARAIFDEHMPTPNQIDTKPRLDVMVTAADLVKVPTGPRTIKGLRHNIQVSVQYLAAWIAGQGCVPLFDLMEDAATAEIGRTLVWQWLTYGAVLDDGRALDVARFRAILAEEMAVCPPSAKLEAARALFEKLSVEAEMEDFLTLPAYKLLEN